MIKRARPGSWLQPSETPPDTLPDAPPDTSAAPLAGAFGEFKILDTTSGPRLGVKTMKDSVSDRDSAVHNVMDAMKEFMLENVHYKPMQAYIVRAFEIKFNAKTASYSITMEAAKTDVWRYIYEDARHTNNRELSTWWVMHDVFRGLQELWRLDFAHRDVKPGNILVFERGGGNLAFKLGDLGNAEKLSTKISQTNKNLYLLGTFPPPIHVYWILLDTPGKLKTYALDGRDVDLYAMVVTYMLMMVDSFDLEPYVMKTVKKTINGILNDEPPQENHFSNLLSSINNMGVPKDPGLAMLHAFFVGVVGKFCVIDKNDKKVAELIDGLMERVNRFGEARHNEIINDRSYIFDDSEVDDLCERMRRAST